MNPLISIAIGFVLYVLSLPLMWWDREILRERLRYFRMRDDRQLLVDTEADLADPELATPPSGHHVITAQDLWGRQ